MGEILVEIEKQFNRIGKEFQSAMDRFQNEGEQLDSFRPYVDILESPASLRMLIDLPGLSREEVQLSVKNGVLSIQGERVAPDAGEASFSRRERHNGRFFRSFPLPESVSAKDVKARFTNGVLEITILKSETPQGEIPIS